MNQYFMSFVAPALIAAILCPGPELTQITRFNLQTEALSPPSPFHTHGPFSGRVVLITGASSGIGAALARGLARQGASVVLVARRKNRLDEVVQEICQTGGKALSIVGDVSVESEIEEAVRRTVETFGGIDFVIANAGTGVQGLLHEVSLDRVRHIINVNILGTMITISKTLPHIIEQKGQIVMIGSVMGFWPMPGRLLYTTTKHALVGLARSLLVDLDSFGVNVMLVSPPYVETELRRRNSEGHFDPTIKDPIPSWMIMPADIVARWIIDAMSARKREVVFSWYGYTALWISRLFPWSVPWLARLTAPKLNKAA